MARSLDTNPAGRRILARLRTVGPFLEGSLTISTKRCGRPTCRCATEGPLHETALLTWKEEQKTRTLYIPMAWRETVAAWVEEGKRLKQLSHAMSLVQRRVLIAQPRPPPPRGGGRRPLASPTPHSRLQPSPLAPPSKRGPAPPTPPRGAFRPPPPPWVPGPTAPGP